MTSKPRYNNSTITQKTSIPPLNNPIDLSSAILTVMQIYSKTNSLWTIAKSKNSIIYTGVTMKKLNNCDKNWEHARQRFVS